MTAADLDPYERTRDTALAGLAVVALLLLLGAYPVLRFATGRALRPVDEMTRQAAEWSATAPNARFGGDQRYAELASLARSLDELLARLAAAVRYERHLSAELSHELRTPLARMTAQIDLAEDGADPVRQQELQRMRANCQTMDGIIDTLMAAARTEFTGAAGRSSAQEVLRRFADPTGSPRVVVEGDAVPVGVDDELVARMLAPVVENARRYARTEVVLRARRAGASVHLDVADDGPAVQLDDRVFEPGVSTRDHGHDGAGLGLALARRLARSADGDLVRVPGVAGTTFRLMPAG